MLKPMTRLEGLEAEKAALEEQLAAVAEAAGVVAAPTTYDGSVAYCALCDKSLPCDCEAQRLRSVLADLPEATRKMLALREAGEKLSDDASAVVTATAVKYLRSEVFDNDALKFYLTAGLLRNLWRSNEAYLKALEATDGNS